MLTPVWGSRTKRNGVYSKILTIDNSGNAIRLERHVSNGRATTNNNNNKITEGYHLTPSAKTVFVLNFQANQSYLEFPARNTCIVYQEIRFKCICRG